MTAEVLIVAFAALAIGVLLGWLLGARPVAAARAELSNAAERAQRLEIEVGRLRGFEGEFAAAQAQIDLLRPMRLELEKERDEALRRGEAAREDLAALTARHAEQTREHAERLQELKEVRDSLPLHFGEVAKRALDEAQTKFLQRADERFKESEATAGQGLKALLAPVETTLKRYEEGLGRIEKEREGSYRELNQAVANLAQGHLGVLRETQRLANVMVSSPKYRGRWGEEHAHNILESAGLRENIDFTRETSVSDGESLLRPDFVVKLPGDRRIVIDVKCPLVAFEQAYDEEDDVKRGELLHLHAKAMATYASSLGRKEYWRQFNNSLDYVIMFVPGEHHLSAAAERAPELINDAFQKGVLITSTINLLGLAKMMAGMWRQEALKEQALEIAEAGRDLYKSLSVMSDHVSNLGKNIGSAALSYNKMIGSLEAGVYRGARRFETLGIESSGKQLANSATIEVSPRALSKLAKLQVDQVSD